jgi:hypothetical protein
VTGKNTLKLKKLLLINLKPPTDATMILRIRPTGLIVAIGVPIRDMIAIYDEAPPCPTEEYKIAPKNIKNAVK